MTMDENIFKLWKEIRPADAFLFGENDCVGRYWVHTQDNIRAALEKVRELRKEDPDEVQSAVLDHLEAILMFREPMHTASNAMWLFFGYMAKEGINHRHLIPMVEKLVQTIMIDKREFDADEYPPEVRITTYNACKALKGIVRSMQDNTENDELKELANLSDIVSEFQRPYRMEGLKAGDFSEVFPILERTSTGKLGRKQYYDMLLKGKYGYYETKEEIEEKAIGWLDAELPRLKELTAELARELKCEPNPDAVAAAIEEHRNIEKPELKDFALKLRSKLQPVFEERIISITPKYETRIIETPAYMLNFIATAAMTTFDSSTDRPFNVFFITTDSKRSPSTSIPEIFQTIIHEEYGHCVNFSNVAAKYSAEPTLLESMLLELCMSTTEGISFHREKESVDLLNDLLSGRELSQAETELVDIIKGFGNPELFLKEYDFTAQKWRIVRFLRAIFDVRINTDKQKMTDFVNWAAELTGIEKKTIFNQTFLFMEAPGYAPAYSLGGMVLAEIQEQKRKEGRDIRKFNTLASGLGFPPKKVFEERLREF